MFSTFYIMLQLILQVIGCNTVQEQAKLNTKECLGSAKEQGLVEFCYK